MYISGKQLKLRRAWAVSNLTKAFAFQIQKVKKKVKSETKTSSPHYIAVHAIALRMTLHMYNKYPYDMCCHAGPFISLIPVNIFRLRISKDASLLASEL